MRIPFVDLDSQYKSIKTEIDLAIQSVIERQAFINGEFNSKFENEFAGKCGVKHCIGVANGTDAMFIALKSMGIGNGDVVMTVANSFIATSEAITLAGAKPFFVDCSPEDFLIDVDRLEWNLQRFTERSKVKAIIPVHLFGQLANMSNIVEFSNQNSLKILEDCAQAHFAHRNGKFAGTYGEAGSFSFYPGKNLGAYGDGGAVVTNDDDLARKIRMYSNHGRIAKYNHEIEGTNSRLDGLQAAILSIKLQYIDSWNAARYSAALKYDHSLAEITDLILPRIPSSGSHVFHLYTIRTSVREKLQNYLTARGVSTGVHYPIALPNLKAYDYLNHKPSDFPVATKFQDEILSLPIFPEISDKQIHFVAGTIRDFFKKF